MQVVGDEEHAAAYQEATIADGPQGLDGGGRPALHVAGTAAAEQVPFDKWGNERQVDDIQMAVELKTLSRSTGIEPNDDSGTLRMTR